MHDIFVWAYATDGLNEPNVWTVWKVAAPNARCTEREPNNARARRALPEPRVLILTGLIGWTERV